MLIVIEKARVGDTFPHDKGEIGLGPSLVLPAFTCCKSS